MATNGEEYVRARLAERDDWSVTERAQIERLGQLMDRAEMLHDLFGDKTLRAADRVLIQKTLTTITNSQQKLENELRQKEKARDKLRGSGRPGGGNRNPDTPDIIAAELAQKLAAFAATDPEGYATLAGVERGPDLLAGVVAAEPLPRDVFAAAYGFPRPTFAPTAERAADGPDSANPADGRPDGTEALSGDAGGPDEPPQAWRERYARLLDGLTPDEVAAMRRRGRINVDVDDPDFSF